MKNPTKNLKRTQGSETNDGFNTNLNIILMGIKNHSTLKKPVSLSSLYKLSDLSRYCDFNEQTI